VSRIGIIKIYLSYIKYYYKGYNIIDFKEKKIESVPKKHSTCPDRYARFSAGMATLQSAEDSNKGYYL